MIRGDSGPELGSPHVLVALNGARDHPAVPRSPKAIAREARAAVQAGATSVHVHAFDETGNETLAPGPCSAVLRTVRAACPGVPISLSTSADIEPDPSRRLALITAWTDQPDLVTANQGEDGIAELCELLLVRGVGIEAGLLTQSDARAFVAARITSRCARVLLEPLDADPHAAVAHATAMAATLDAARISIERIYHGDGIASWAVNRYGVSRGCGIRTGLEDTPVLPDGRLASGNAELVAAAFSLIAQARDAEVGPAPASR